MSIERELVKELRKIYDDRDFVNGVMTLAEDEDGWKEILDYIAAEEVTAGLVTARALDIDLRRQRGK